MKLTIRQLAGWLTHEEAEELRTSLDVFNQINVVWIAASCMEVGGRRLTRNKHFDVVDQIETIILGTFSNEPKAI